VQSNANKIRRNWQNKNGEPLFQVKYWQNFVNFSVFLCLSFGKILHAWRQSVAEVRSCE